MSNYQNSELYVAGKLYDTREVLEINDNYEIEEVEIDSQNKIIVIDNFYSNPDLIREIAFNGTATRKASLGYPGYRFDVEIGNSNETYVYNKSRQDLLKKVWGINTKFEDDKLLFNIVKNYNTWPNINGEYYPELQPHHDHGRYNSLVYLNKDNEWNGKNGTGIYRHKQTGLVAFPEDEKERFNIVNEVNKTQDAYGLDILTFKEVLWLNEYRLPTGPKEWLTDSNNVWELEYLIEMKYNRMAIYSGALFHSAYLNKTDFKDGIRVTQPGFMEIKELFKKFNGD